MNNLKKEYKDFLEDIDANIKNKDDLEYIKERFSKFIDIVINEINNASNLKNDKLDRIEEMQKIMDDKISKIQKAMGNTENSMYEEDYDLEIICPFCNNNLIIENCNDKTEVECPECNNNIELDWFDDDIDEDM